MKNKTVNISIDGKEYISLSVPEGSKVTIEDGVTLVEPEKYIPKVGDFFKTAHTIGRCDVMVGTNPKCTGSFIDITKQQVNTEIGHSTVTIMSHSNKFTKITPAELQAEFKKLGYEYNFETNTAVKIRWRAEEKESYYYIDDECKIERDSEQFHEIDDNRYNSGNYFKTEQLAQKCAEIEKDARMNFHNELK